MNRRRALRAVATAGTTALATGLGGCLGDDGTATATADRTTDEDDCLGATRLSFRYESVEQDFVVRSSTDSVVVGETLSLRLRNVAAVEQTTGSRDKIDVQRETADGWRSVFGRPPEQVWTDEAIPHEPGEGFDWNLSVGDDGFEFAESVRPQYRTCDPVEPGRYRFVFWGVVGLGDDEPGVETAVTRAFRIRES